MFDDQRRRRPGHRAGTVRLSNNGVYNNLTGFGCGGGTLASAGNNRKAGNAGGVVPVCAPTVGRHHPVDVVSGWAGSTCVRLSQARMSACSRTLHCEPTSRMQLRQPARTRASHGRARRRQRLKTRVPVRSAGAATGNRRDLIAKYLLLMRAFRASSCSPCGNSAASSEL